MSKKTLKDPKQLFITLKNQDDYEWITDSEHEDGGWRALIKQVPLGFANDPTGPAKAFEKRRHTAMSWAYNTYGSFEEREDGVYDSGRHHWVDGGAVQDPPARFEERFQPITIDNVPLEGFKITTSVSRYRSSNKLWRILDPRGFELEISTGSFEDLVLSATIVKGVIQGKCIWHTGKILRTVAE